jgi:putative copper export protein
MLLFIGGVLTCFFGLAWYGQYLAYKRRQEMLLRLRQTAWIWIQFARVRPCRSQNVLFTRRNEK